MMDALGGTSVGVVLTISWFCFGGELLSLGESLVAFEGCECLVRAIS
jgi:hypothetical protein